MPEPDVDRPDLGEAAGRYDLPEVPWREDAPLPVVAPHQIHAFKRTAELFAALTGDGAAFDAVCLRIRVRRGRRRPLLREGVSTGRLVRNIALPEGRDPGRPWATTSIPPGWLRQHDH